MFDVDREQAKLLLDEDFLEFISDVPEGELGILMDMLIMSRITGDEITSEAVRTILTLSPSREGRRSDQIVEVLRERGLIENDGNTEIDVPEQGDGVREKRKKRSLFRGWGLKGAKD